MKKIAIFMFLCFCTSVLSAQAIYTSTVKQIMLPDIDDNYINPICKWDDNRSIVNLKDRYGVNYFCVVDYSSFFIPFFPTPPLPPTVTGRYATLPSPSGADISVNDIYYTENHVFFCGSIRDLNNNVENAIVGYFDPNDIASTGNTGIVYRKLYNGTTNAPTTLYRLVAYKVNEKYDVVAFGDDLSGYPASHDYSMAKIVEIQDIFGNPPTCYMADMAYGVVFNPDIPGYQITQKQYLDDIFLTEKNVVLTGHDWNYPPTTNPSVVNMRATYHYGMKGNVVMDIITQYHNYCLDGYWETNDTVVGVALDGDKFAISYVYPDYNHNVYTRVRVIDPSLSYDTYSVQFWKTQKENPVRMAFHERLKAVEILQPIFNRSDFVMVDIAAPTSFVAPVLNPTPDRYRTMHGIRGNSFISSNEKYIYLQNRSSALPPSTTGCPNVDYVDVTHIEPIYIDTTLAPSRFSFSVDNIIYHRASNRTLQIDKYCFSFEYSNIK